MHPLGSAAKLSLRLLEDFEKAARVGRLEPATGEAEARPEVLPWPLGRLRPELLQAVADSLLEVLVGDLTTAVADQEPVLGEQPGLCQAEKGGQHQSVGQVPAGAEEDEHCRPGQHAVVGHDVSLAS